MHRAKYDRLYRIWKAMRVRCNNPNFFEYHRYGGRGIKVCEEWNDYFAFRSWALDNGYSDTLTIDRINNDKGYSPENCRWLSIQEQQLNRSSTVKITFNGRTQCITQWAKELGIDRHVIRKRLNRGLSVEEAFRKVVVA